MLRVADIDELEEGGPGDFDIRKAIGIGRARELMRGRGDDPVPPSRECVRRWITRGCSCGPLRQVVRLKARRISGEYLTTPGWVAEFERERVRLSALDPLADEVPNRTREAQKRAAELALDKAGIGSKRAPGG